METADAADSQLTTRFRIGINVGDVMVKDGDIFGDGVNVAARLESLATGGGICVSRGVGDHLGSTSRSRISVKNGGVARLVVLRRTSSAIPVVPFGNDNFLKRLEGLKVT
jgi:class 3 adenylate cyclase